MTDDKWLQAREALHLKYITMCPKKLDHVSFDFNEPNNGAIEVKVTVNGWYDSPEHFHLPNTSKPYKPIVEWLEQILTKKNYGAAIMKALGEDDDISCNTLYYEPMPYGAGKDEKGDILIKHDRGLFYLYDHSKGIIKTEAYCDTDNFVRFIYTRMKWDAQKKQHTIFSETIESYYMNKSEYTFEYKGYFTIIKPLERDLRYYGRIYEMDKPDNPMESGAFAADNETEAKERFGSVVEDIINAKEWREKNSKWKESGIDVESIGYVFDILPEKFRERIITGQFDKSLNNGVKGGDYIVPLYYVTKAWDVLLKGRLGHYAYKIGPEEDEDYEKDLKEFWEEEAERSRCEACRQNDEMKAIWKELLGMDIDTIEVDFAKYDKHLPPNVDEKAFFEYFFDVPKGVFEWIFDGISFPTGMCFCESVSALMEFTALIVKEREKWN